MANVSPPSARSYHCICTTLILVTPHPLSSLSTRAPPVQDNALILPLSSPTSNLHNLVTDKRALIIKREDGFEKRTCLRCSRCQLVIGYRLDGLHFEDPGLAEDVVYILPGGLVETEEMVVGKEPEEPSWAAV